MRPPLVVVALSLLVAPSIHAEPAPVDDVTAWFRIDTDALATQLWAGAVHPVGPLALASDVEVVGSLAEVDVGPSLTLGRVNLTPMIGVSFDFAANRVASVVPQLFTLADGHGWHLESWLQAFLGRFHADGEDLLYARTFVLRAFGRRLALGPQVELAYRWRTSVAGPRGWTAIPVGGQLSLSYGDRNTLALFLGYDAKAPATSDRVAGRVTFVRTW